MILPTDIVPLSPMSGGDLDLIRLSSAAPIQPASGLSATRINPGYGIGVTLPRTMNRVALTLATAVILGLLPMVLAVWMNWI